MNMADIPESAPIRKVKDIPSFLEQLRRRPGLWLGFGEESVLALCTIFEGIQLAEFFYDVPKSKRLGNFNFEKYEKWVNAEYNLDKLSVNSFHLANIRAGSDIKGFWLWFEWYDQFQSLSSV